MRWCLLPLVRFGLGVALLGGVTCAAPGGGTPAAAPSPAGRAQPTAVPTVPRAAPTPPPAPVALRLPYTAISVVNAPLWVAAEAGHFAEEGIDATIEYIATSTTLTQAMLAGEVAIANSGLEALVAANVAGADLIAVAIGTDRFIFRIYGSAEVPTLADLRGRRVGVTRYGSTTDTLTRLLLRRAGLDPERDATIVQVGGVPEIFAALQSGAIDAGALSPPTMFRVGPPYNLLVDTTETDIYFHQAVLVTLRRYLAENEDIVRRVVRGYLRGVARFKQDKAFAMAVTGKYTQTDDPLILEASWAAEDRVLPRVPLVRADAVQLALEEAAAQYPAAAGRQPTEFYDNRLVQEQEANGFIASLYR